MAQMNIGAIVRCTAIGDRVERDYSLSEVVMHWIYLLCAGLLEIGWAIGLKYTEGFSKLWPTVLTLLGMVGSVLLLALAVQKIPLGTAYAIWTGIGALGAVVLGIVLFGESSSGPRLLFAGIILLGILGLKMTAE